MKEDDEVNSPDTSITNTPSNLPSGEFYCAKKVVSDNPGLVDFAIG